MYPAQTTDVKNKIAPSFSPMWDLDK